MVNSSDFVQWFRHALPYINSHRERTFVISLPGEALAHQNLENIIHDVALLNSLGIKVVLVHGARPQLNEVLAECDIATEFHQGTRVTDLAALEALQQVCGQLQFELESLFSTSLPNTPMHGSRIRIARGNFVTAKPRGIIDGVDFLHSGHLRKVDSDAIHQQLALNNLVILSPLAASPTGELFSLPLNELCAKVAADIRADKLILLGKDEGVENNDGSILRAVNLSDAKNLQPENKQQNELLKTACAALDAGVNRCHILSYQKNGALLDELFSHDGNGTLVSFDNYEKQRQADIHDVAGILELIKPLEAEGILVRREREHLEAEVSRFTVLERDGRIVACAALYPFAKQGIAEVACVVTHPDYQKGGRAERLLQALELQAKELNLTTLFVLTTQTSHWFQQQGFAQADLEILPEEKQSLYNFQRNSKVFAKNIA